MTIRKLELALAAAKRRCVAATRECQSLALQLRWARVKAGVYESPGAALVDLFQTQLEVTADDLIEMLGCGRPRANGLLRRYYLRGLLRKVRRGVYARPKK